jgi:arylsulfatase
MAGKWHPGFRDDRIPYNKGFDRSFPLLDGGATHFGNNAIFENGPPQYRLDNQPVSYPEGKYSSGVYTGKMMEFIQHARKGRPFFVYLAYTAPHWPLQVPDDYLDKYRGKYNMGYNSLRVLRFKQQKAKRIIPLTRNCRPASAALSPGRC